jgi:hypothetical protein
MQIGFWPEGIVSLFAKVRFSIVWYYMYLPGYSSCLYHKLAREEPYSFVALAGIVKMLRSVHDLQAFETIS